MNHVTSIASQAQSHEEILKNLLETQNSYELSIIKLSQPVSRPLTQVPAERTSDVSTDVLDIPTPASLQADLTHYMELFSKLRFSYLEQVTKEKFIRAIVGDPPVVVDHQDNVDLEVTLAASKAELKAQKSEVAELVAELEARGRQLCQKHQNIQFQTAQLQEFPDKIKGLQASIEGLKAAQQLGANPALNMSLERTLALVEMKEIERLDLDKQLEQLQLVLPRKTRELERLNLELQPLEVRRLGSTASAREAERRKREALGGVGNGLEDTGRWWRGVESGLKSMLSVEN